VLRPREGEQWSLLLLRKSATCCQSKAPSSVQATSCRNLCCATKSLLHRTKLVKCEGASSRSRSVVVLLRKQVYRPLRINKDNLSLFSITVVLLDELRLRHLMNEHMIASEVCSKANKIMQYCNCFIGNVYSFSEYRCFLQVKIVLKHDFVPLLPYRSWILLFPLNLLDAQLFVWHVYSITVKLICCCFLRHFNVNLVVEKPTTSPS